MKIVTEYYGRVNPVRKYNAERVRKKDRRKTTRRNSLHQVKSDQRKGLDRRSVLERRMLLQEPFGIIRVFGMWN